jgi:hypothetical protein
MRWNGLLPLTIAALLAGASPAAAETFTVAGTTDVTGPCDATTCASIRQALAAAEGTSGPDTIRVPAGDFQLTQGALTVDSAVTIVGAGARDTIVHGDAENRVFDVVASADAVISHLTMRDGHATPSGNYFGGNLTNYGGTVVLDHVRVTQGHGYSAGGVANRSGTMTIQYSLIDHNFADNEGSDVGGVMNFGGDGAPASMTVRDSTVAFNESQLGGGISTSSNAANTLRLERVTIAYNYGGSRTDVPNAGGLSIQSGHSVVVAGSIIAGNSTAAGPSNCTPQPIISEGYNLQDGTDCQLAGTGDRQSTNPQFVGPEAELANAGGETDVLMLTPSSPAVDLVPGCTGFDQRDVSRPQGSACDAGAFEVDQAPETALEGAAPPFTFGSNKPGSRFECAIDGGPFAACTSPWTPAGVAAGAHTLAVRAIDSAGTADASPTTRSFTVAATPLPAQPTPTPVPTPTPTPAPVAGKSVAAEPVSGKVLVKLPGSKNFVELDPSVIPNGAEVDTRKGTVEITRSDGQVAKFFDGIFKLTQAGGITTLTLSEQLDCPKKGKASAAAKKPKTRKLWGDGKGTFRTRGQYSAATVRGTKWLVTDTCTSTITKVSQGVVKVRDEVKKKTIIVRKGKSYTARPKR